MVKVVKAFKYVSAAKISEQSMSSETAVFLRVLTYQPTVRVPNVQALDTSYLTSSLADYAVPFHPSTLATIPTDMQSESAG